MVQKKICKLHYIYQFQKVKTVDDLDKLYDDIDHIIDDANDEDNDESSEGSDLEVLSFVPAKSDKKEDWLLSMTYEKKETHEVDFEMGKYYYRIYGPDYRLCIEYDGKN